MRAVWALVDAGPLREETGPVFTLVPLQVLKRGVAGGGCWDDPLSTPSAELFLGHPQL